MRVLPLLAAINLAGVLAFLSHAWGAIPTPVQDLVLAGLCALVVKYVARIPGPTQRFFAWTTALIGHIGSPVVRGLLQRLDDAIKTAVLWGEQVLIVAIQGQVADGTLSPDKVPAALADVKSQVTAKVHELLTLQGILQVIVLVVFGGKPDGFLNFLDHRIEAHVAALPASGVTAAIQTKGAPASPSVPAAA